MNKIWLILFPILICWSCIEDRYIADYAADENLFHVLSDESKFTVTMSDIDDFLNFRKLEAAGKGKQLVVDSVQPIFAENGRISMYMIEYGEGWELISADKRSMMLVAKSDRGEFDFSQNNPIQKYVAHTANNIQKFISNSDNHYECTKSHSDENLANLAFWDALSAETSFIETKSSRPDWGPITPEGRWELTEVTSVDVVYDTIPHLTTTRWHQNDPYNIFCPYKTDNPMDHSPAGCVAIAAAQMLYFLHENLGLSSEIPNNVPSIGSVNGAFYPNGFSNFSSDHWDSLDSLQNDRAAFISYVGKLSETKYGNTGSS